MLHQHAGRPVHAKHDATHRAVIHTAACIYTFDIFQQLAQAGARADQGWYYLKGFACASH